MKLKNGQQNRLFLLEKLSNELTSYFQANGSLKEIIIFLKSASDVLYDDSILFQNSNQNVANVNEKLIHYYQNNLY